MDPRAVDALLPNCLRHFLGFVEPIQANVGVEEPPIRRFRVRLQLRRDLTFLESLFELPQGDQVFAQGVMRSPGEDSSRSAVR